MIYFYDYALYSDSAVTVKCYGAKNGVVAYECVACGAEASEY